MWGLYTGFASRARRRKRLFFVGVGVQFHSAPASFLAFCYVYYLTQTSFASIKLPISAIRPSVRPKKNVSRYPQHVRSVFEDTIERESNKREGLIPLRPLRSITFHVKIRHVQSLI